MKTFSHQGSERQRLPRQAFQFCIHISRRYGRFAIPALLAVFLGQSLGISNTYVLKELVDAINLKEEAMWTWAMIYLAVFAFSTISWRSSGYLGMHWITRARLQAARVLYDWLSQHSSHYFSDRFAGSLATKVTNASNGISHMLSKLLWDFLPTILRLVLSMVIAYLAKPILALILGGWAVLFLVLNALLVKRKAVLSKESAGSYTRLKGQMVDILTNIRVVHLFARRQAEIEHVDDHIDDFQRNIFRSWRYSEGVLLLNNALQVVLLGLMLVLTLRLLENGLLTVGEVIMVITLTWGILDALLFIGSSMNAVMESYGEVQEGLDEVLKEHELIDLPGAPRLEVKHGDIHLDGVDFGYESDKLVFQNFNLHIPAGQKVGLVGESGAGKTTLTQLLLRMYDVQSGAIYLDDQDISLYSQESLRETISYVPQASQLFHRSINDNIGYGDRSAEKAEIVLAAERARAHHFVKDLSQGYDTLVGERGVKLSGGQAQRISIARAMLKDAPILILDEATSSLDSESERMVQDALENLIVGKTVIAIAHRLSTLLAMDRILVMEDGAIIEDGTHHELLERNGTYARLWKHQIGGFLVGA